MICGLCRVSGRLLKFRLLTNASHPCLVSNVFSVSSNCWMHSIFCQLVLSLNSLVTSSRQITDAHQIEVIHFPPSAICQDGR